jgi:hypothetical protein
MAMTPEKERELVEKMWEHIATSSIPLVCTIDRDDLRAALSIAAPILRDEALEEAESLPIDVVGKRLGMDKDQKVYGWHEVMDALEVCRESIRALKSKGQKLS